MDKETRTAVAMLSEYVEHLFRNDRVYEVEHCDMLRHVRIVRRWLHQQHPEEANTLTMNEVPFAPR
jgi:hypothetical protein